MDAHKLNQQLEQDLALELKKSKIGTSPSKSERFQRAMEIAKEFVLAHRHEYALVRNAGLLQDISPEQLKEIVGGIGNISIAAAALSSSVYLLGKSENWW
ncbi:MAG: hypothetical protein A3C55_01390 [Gammaproteobacteria bacterium RIFCSPHIGHO2_02_FULL_42_13]|nr:MAG: hypothetical protein A3C55_01390 [Gammaproteobacteria bacterium RIFCSPHIGHO2_02_FULL_42_13]OGT68931.1 MAG: hypothetical protein A3H43_03515 [Gammaproteobacteria bacterium RIFCSPLOWO2_02_FULL_42_9]